jgi:hypothetical protein
MWRQRQRLLLPPRIKRLLRYGKVTMEMLPIILHKTTEENADVKETRILDENEIVENEKRKGKEVKTETAAENEIGNIEIVIATETETETGKGRVDEQNLKMAANENGATRKNEGEKRTAGKVRGKTTRAR